MSAFLNDHDPVLLLVKQTAHRLVNLTNRFFLRSVENLRDSQHMMDYSLKEVCMITISLCMIVKNEEKVLARCLESVRDIADEIVIVDTGSQDRTKEIASQFTDKVHDFEWIDDFAAARNYAFSLASMEYCMWLDADDVVLSKDREEILQLKNALDPDTNVVMMKYHTSFDENGVPTFSYYRERMIRNRAGFLWEGAVHEAISPRGKIVYSDAAITHKKSGPSDPNRNLRIFEKLIAQGTKLDARQQFYYGRELYYHERYQDAIQALVKFLDSGKGWIENNIDACRILAYCYYQQNEEEKALLALLRSLSYDAPRAELSCDIGKHFFDRGQYTLAVFWYETAAGAARNDQSGAFVSPDCYGYIPYLQLCVCYDRLGEIDKAEAYNELAGDCKPQSPQYLANKQYFDYLKRIGTKQ